MAKKDAPRRGGAAQNSGDTDDGYEVGYGRPPKQGRFKPGQSGNPKGRPKHSRNLRTLFEEVLKETLTIREGDRTRTLTKGEAVVRTVVNGALRKEPKALQAFLALGRATGFISDEPEAATPPELSPDDEALIAEFFGREGRGR